MLLVLLLFSEQGLFAERLNNRVCYYLGRHSMLMYLCHIEFAKCVYTKVNRPLTVALGNRPLLRTGLGLAIYFLGVAVNMFIVHQVSNVVRKHGRKLTRIFVAQ